MLCLAAGYNGFYDGIKSAFGKLAIHSPNATVIRPFCRTIAVVPMALERIYRSLITGANRINATGGHDATQLSLELAGLTVRDALHMMRASSSCLLM